MAWRLENCKDSAFFFADGAFAYLFCCKKKVEPYGSTFFDKMCWLILICVLR